VNTLHLHPKEPEMDIVVSELDTSLASVNTLQECVIAIPCIVDGSRISAFSYNTCVCELT